MHSTPICRNSSMKTYLVLFLLFFNGVEAAVDGLNCRNCGEIIETNSGKSPWEAKIKVSEPSYSSRRCRGILVGSRHMLSVGTCLCDLLGLCHDDPAVGGHVFAEDDKGNTLRASHLAFHPDYRMSPSHDVALVGTDKFEEFGGEFSPICLPDQSANFQDFQVQLVISGGEVATMNTATAAATATTSATYFTVHTCRRKIRIFFLSPRFLSSFAAEMPFFQCWKCGLVGGQRRQAKGCPPRTLQHLLLLLEHWRRPSLDVGSPGGRRRDLPDERRPIQEE